MVFTSLDRRCGLNVGGVAAKVTEHADAINAERSNRFTTDTCTKEWNA
jgi:hypothetical protein